MRTTVAIFLALILQVKSLETEIFKLSLANLIGKLSDGDNGTLSECRTQLRHLGEESGNENSSWSDESERRKFFLISAAEFLYNFQWQGHGQVFERKSNMEIRLIWEASTNVWWFTIKLTTTTLTSMANTAWFSSSLKNPTQRFQCHQSEAFWTLDGNIWIHVSEEQFVFPHHVHLKLFNP